MATPCLRRGGRLELPENLERVVCSTKLIENLFSQVREIACRVRRWRHDDPALERG
jgi:hypothetical protein